MPSHARFGRISGRVGCGLVLLLLVAAIPALLPAPAGAATYSLYGDLTLGWGLTPASITSPGPLLIVSVGETVTLNLFSADSRPHSWCIDFNANGNCEATGENVSGTFTSPSTALVHTFVVPNLPSTYSYICGVHGPTPMSGPIRIAAPVRPTVTISTPSGSQDWTGGSTHTIWWNMTSPTDPVTSLVVFVNYTIGAVTTRIAGPVPGTANPNSLPWTLPLANTTNAFVNVTAIDTAGRHGWDVKPVPTIDSSVPTIVGRVPANGATGVSTSTSVIVTFDEAMDRTATATPGTTALQDTTTLGYVPVTYTWNPAGTVLTMRPASALAPNRMYRALVNASARDASDPGNGLAAPSMWVFTTATGADLEPPRITNPAAAPPVAEAGTETNLSATVTDNDRVAAAYAVVTFPDLTPANHSMTAGVGNEWSWSQAYPQLGSYLFHVEAVDPSGNWNRSASAGFQAVDTTRPAIGTPTLSPSPGEVYSAVNVSVPVTDPFLASVTIDIAGVLNETMGRDTASGDWFKVFTPADVRSYAFVVYAEDTSGNRASAAGSAVVQDTMPPPVPQSLVASIAPDGSAVALSWAGVSAPDLAGYRVYRASSPTGAFTSIGGQVNGTSYTDRSVAGGATYYYRVTAVDLRNLESAPSNIVSVTVPVPPADLLPVVAAGAVVAIVAALAAAFLVLRRKRRKDA